MNTEAERFLAENSQMMDKKALNAIRTFIDEYCPDHYEEIIQRVKISITIEEPKSILFKDIEPGTKFKIIHKPEPRRKCIKIKELDDCNTIDTADGTAWWTWPRAEIELI